MTVYTCMLQKMTWLPELLIPELSTGPKRAFGIPGPDSERLEVDPEWVGFGIDKLPSGTSICSIDISFLQLYNTFKERSYNMPGLKITDFSVHGELLLPPFSYVLPLLLLFHSCFFLLSRLCARSGDLG